jgi:hypothetical protein
VLPVVTNADSQTSPASAAGIDGRFLVLNQGSLNFARHTMASVVNSEAVPRLDAGTVGTSGPFQFRFRGAVDQRYAIETSEDLQTWTQLWSFTNSSPAVVLIDPATTNLPARFYRAQLLP